MIDIYRIPLTFVFRPGQGWKHSFQVGSSLNGAAPVNWADITIKGYICNTSNWATVQKAVSVTNADNGNFEASLSEADIAALTAGTSVLVFIYKVAGDANAYPLGVADVTVTGGLPAW